MVLDADRCLESRAAKLAVVLWFVPKMGQIIETPQQIARASPSIKDASFGAMCTSAHAIAP
jgi:hypothetical protein